jgi:predicted nucleic acid-binding protein
VIVVDTSAVVDVLVPAAGRTALTARLEEAGSLHAPHLLDTEFAAALRRLVLRDEISPGRADDALRAFERLTITRYPARHLLPAIWAYRDLLTAYDATFVALARALDCPLVTCDRALARAHHGISVEAF